LKGLHQICSPVCSLWCWLVVVRSQRLKLPLSVNEKKCLVMHLHVVLACSDKTGYWLVNGVGSAKPLPIFEWGFFFHTEGHWVLEACALMS
jgi:hypothetical protein